MARPRASQPRSPSHAALGEAIESMMRERALTQKRVARDSGINVRHVGSFIRGEGNPTYDTLLKLCDGLHVRLSELLVRADERLGGQDA